MAKSRVKPQALQKLLDTHRRRRPDLQAFMGYPKDKRGVVYEINRGTRQLKNEEALKIAEFLGISVDIVLREMLLHPGERIETSSSNASGQERHNIVTVSRAKSAHRARLSTAFGRDADLPVLGRPVENGAVTVHGGDVLDYIPRPLRLINNQEAFGFLVPDDSMAPRFVEGDRLFVDPLAPLQPGRGVLLVSVDMTAVARELVSRDMERLTVCRTNPPETQDVAITDLYGAYRIVGSVDA